MTEPILIPLCERDLPHLAPCIESARAAGLNGEVLIAPCRRNPPTLPKGKFESTRPILWRKPATPFHILAALREALGDTAPAAIKLDADIRFIRLPAFLSDPQPGLSGWTHIRHPYAVAGACYRLDTESTARLANANLTAETSSEDVAISRWAHRLGIPVRPSGRNFCQATDAAIAAHIEALHLGPPPQP